MKKVNAKTNVSTTNAKKYEGVYAMGDAPIVVRGLVKYLLTLDFEGYIEGISPRNGGEVLAVVLASAIKELNGGESVNIKDFATVKRGDSIGLYGRGDAMWEDIAINEAIANYLAPTTAPNAKKSNKK